MSQGGEAKKVVVAMLGARRHYAVPRLLHEAGLLERFYTDSYAGNKPLVRAGLNVLSVLLNLPEVKRWLGRTDTVLPPEKVVSFDRFGWWYAAARRKAQTAADVERVFADAAVRFSCLIGSSGLRNADVLWGFNGASLELFAAAKERGIRCVLEQTILPRRLMNKLLEEETERWPGWSRNQAALLSDPIFALRDEREEQEWELADCIVAGSDFVSGGLAELGVTRNKLRVVPYGVDATRFSGAAKPRPTTSGQPLRVLFAGEVGLRKGVPDLLQALDLMPRGAVDMRFAGNVALAENKLAQWRKRVCFLGAVPRPEMRALYHWADILVLPSIVEGSAAVTYEALMSGVPVIATPNVGSIVRNGVDGFIVSIRNPEALAAAMNRYHEDRGLLARHSAAAEESRRIAGLERYREDLIQLVRSFSND